MKIIAKRKISDNNSKYEYKLDDNNIISGKEAYQMTLEGKLEGITYSHNGNTKYIKAINDGNKNNNLDDLPEF